LVRLVEANGEGGATEHTHVVCVKKAVHRARVWLSRGFKGDTRLTSISVLLCVRAPITYHHYKRNTVFTQRYRTMSSLQSWPWLQKNGTLMCLDPSSLKQSGGGGVDTVSDSSTEQTLISIVAHLTQQQQQPQLHHYHECSTCVMERANNDDDAATMPCLSRVTEVYLSLDILDLDHGGGDDEHISVPPQKEQQHHTLPLIWTQLWQCLSQNNCLPNLETLRLYSSRHHDNNGLVTTRSAVLAQQIAQFVRHSPPKWHTLIVTRCLELNSTLIATLSAALMHHPTLQQVKLLDVALSETTATWSDSGTTNNAACNAAVHVPLLDPLLAALSTIATLESLDLTLFHHDTHNHTIPAHQRRLLYPRHNATVRSTAVAPAAPMVPAVPQRTASAHSLLTAHHASSRRSSRSSQCRDYMSPRALHDLLVRCDRLEDVSLWNCGLHNAHLDYIGRALLSARCAVRFLSLRRNPHITSDAWEGFYTYVVPDNYTLQALYHDCVDDLSMALWCTTTTTSTATTAPKLSCAATTATSTVATAAVPLLVSPPAPPPRPNANSSSAAAAAAALYLCLNRLGRGALLRNHHGDNSLADWCDLLGTVSYTPSAIFALLSHRPLLLVEAAAAATTNVE
jgi:hypothetical protein